MKNRPKRNRLRPALAAAFLGPLVLSAPARQAPAFAPERGARQQKSFTTEWDLQLDDFSLYVDGNDLGAMAGAFEVSLFVEQIIAVTDVYKRVGQGRPLVLNRTYDTLEGVTTVSIAHSSGGEDQEVDSSSELEGSTVVFTWNPGTQSYDAAFEDDGDEALLEDVEEDMDLRVFLPQEEVGEGDSWDVPIADLTSIGSPGGNLQILPEDVDWDEMGPIAEMLEDRMSDIADIFAGDCICTLVAQRGDEEAPLAEIEIEIEAAASADLSDILMDILDYASQELGGEIPEVSIEAADLNFDFFGEGVLLWNMEKGLVDSFELTGEADVAFEISVQVVDPEGQSHSAEISLEVSGTFEEILETETEE